MFLNDENIKNIFGVYLMIQTLQKQPKYAKDIEV